MRVQFFIFFLPILIAMPAHSIRVIGNGGGFAEMQAVYLNQNLPLLLDTSGVYPEFKNWLEAFEDFSFSFDPACPVIDQDYIEKNPSIIPSCILYSSDTSALGQVPKSLNEIGAIIFAFRWLQFYSNSDFQFGYQKGLEFFSDIQLLQKKIPLTLRSIHIASVHIWKVQFSSTASLKQQATLELPGHSLNLIKYINTATACPSPITQLNIDYLSVQTLRDSGFNAIGPASWSCLNHIYTGELHLTVENYTKKSPEKTRLWVDVFKRKRLK